MSTKKLASFIVVTYNSVRTIDACVKSLLAQREKSYEVIVVDNGSQDQTLDRLKKYHTKVKVIQNTNSGFGGGNNVGIKYASGKYCIFVNPDAIVPTDLLGRTEVIFKANKKIGILGYRMINEDGSLQRTCNTFPTIRSLLVENTAYGKIIPSDKAFERYIMNDWDRSSSREVDAVSGACFAVRSSILRQVQGFDERFFLFYEEFDLAKRVKALGFSVFFDASTNIKHIGGVSTQQTGQDSMTKVYLESQALYIQKHMGLATWVYYRIAAKCVSLAYMIKLRVTRATAG